MADITEDLRKLRELLGKATPGPWKNHGRQPKAIGVPHSAVAAKTLLARVYSEAFGDTEQETANAELIAAAVNALPGLLDECEMLRKDAARYRWLAGNGWADAAFYATGPKEWGVGGVALLSGPQLDAAIDAAMQEQQR